MNYFTYLAAVALSKIKFIEPDLTGFIYNVNANPEPVNDKDNYNHAEDNQNNGNQHPIRNDISQKNIPGTIENLTRSQQPEENFTEISDAEKQNIQPGFYSEKIMERLRHTQIIEHNNDSILRIDEKITSTDDLYRTNTPEKLFNKISSQTSALPGSKESDTDLPAINITIGKIEVKAVQSERKTENKHSDQKPSLSLNEYLKSFNKGKQ